MAIVVVITVMVSIRVMASIRVFSDQAQFTNTWGSNRRDVVRGEKGVVETRKKR